MKKVILIILFMMIIPICSVYSEEVENSDYESIIKESIEASGANDLEEKLDSNAKNYLDENNISIEDPTSVLSVGPKEVMSYIWTTFKSNLSAPLKMFGALVAVIILTSLIENLGDSVKSSSLSKIYNIISVLICIAIIAQPVINCIYLTTNTLTIGGNFMIGYVPVFSSIVASSGNITSAGSYNVIVLIVAETAVQLSINFILPLMGLYMALAIVDAVNPSLSLSGMTNGIKKFSLWGIGFIMTVFVGLLSIQSIVGTSADTLGIKTARFMVSSLVPVVGGAMSEAYSTVRGSLGLLRGGVGTFGIIALLLTVMPNILAITAFYLMTNLSGLVADVFQTKQVSGLIKNISSVLSIALGLLISFSLMLIISTTIVMMAGMNIN